MWCVTCGEKVTRERAIPTVRYDEQGDEHTEWQCLDCISGSTRRVSSQFVAYLANNLHRAHLASRTSAR